MFSQAKQIDSLEHALMKASGKSRVVLRNQLSQLYTESNDLVKAMQNAKIAEKESIALKYTEGLISAYENQGRILGKEKKLEKAFLYYSLALKEIEPLNNKKGKANIQSNIGVLFLAQENVTKALEYFFASLQLRQEISDTSGISDSYSNIGVSYNKKGEPNKALEFHLKAKEIREKLKDPERLQASLFSIGNVYGALEKPTEALKYHILSLNTQSQRTDETLKIKTYMNIGRDYALMEKYDSSLKYLSLGLEEAKKRQDQDLIISCYGNLSGMYENKKDFENAFKYAKIYHDAMDSFFRSNMNAKILEMSAKFETENKNAKIKLLSREKESRELEIVYEKRNRKILVIFFTAILVLAATAGLFIFKNYKQKQNIKIEKIGKEKMRAELSLLKNQISPHVMFNVLNTIYIQVDDNVKDTKEMILLFSDLLSYQLYDCSVDFVTLEEEINYLNKFISIQRLRRGEICKVTFTTSGDIGGIQVTPLLFIPLVENAFKYVTNDKNSDNFVAIDLRLEKRILTFKVLNTTHEELSSKEKKVGGIGLSNLMSRLNLIYPKKSDLTTFKEGNIFNAVLTIHV